MEITVAVMDRPSVTTGRRRRPRVLVVTPEIARLPAGMGDHARGVAAKGSDLADMTAALIAALDERGVDVHVALPHYRNLFTPAGNGLDRWGRTRMSRSPDSRVHLAEDRLFYYQDGVDSYAVNGDLRPALFFQREVINHIVPWVQPDLVHCHDWMTGLIPAMARRLGIPCLFTVHNPVTRYATLAEIEETGIDAAEFWQYLYYERWPENYETTRSTNPVDFLASAVISADYVNATSPGLLAEIVVGTEDVVSPHLRREIIRKADQGLVSAILTAANRDLRPSRDRSLAHRYTAPHQRLGKHLNKAALRRRIGLPHNGESPLIFWPSRTDSRRAGRELFGSLMPLALSQYGAQKLQIVVAGAECRHGAQNVFLQTHRSGATAVMADFDDDLRQLTYAASDFTLIPSRYERCGMSETVALLYGSLPVALAPGGPGDDLAPLETEANNGNAFPFRRANVGDVADAVERAMRFHEEPADVKTAQVERVMKQSARTRCSSNMARSYVAVYEKLLGRPVDNGSARPRES